MTNSWSEIVLRNFSDASSMYNHHADLQRTFAFRLANECSKQIIPPGIWADLGAGTGLLAEALEKLHTPQTVIRVDHSQKMLEHCLSNKPSKLWDLNLGLPKWPQPPTLLASSFALHWLKSPTYRLQEWFKALAPGGWLAIAVPIHGSFPEWQAATKKANVLFTGFPLPSQKSLLAALQPSHIKYQEVQRFHQYAEKALSLLKPLVHVGGKYTPKPAISVGDWRRIQRSWPRSKKNGSACLTWSIQMLLIQK